jgi:hypothetical protein
VCCSAAAAPGTHLIHRAHAQKSAAAARLPWRRCKQKVSDGSALAYTALAVRSQGWSVMPCRRMRAAIDGAAWQLMSLLTGMTELPESGPGPQSLGQ